jgi:hypothetical protein
MLLCFNDEMHETSMYQGDSDVTLLVGCVERCRRVRGILSNFKANGDWFVLASWSQIEVDFLEI